jgi:hypothetical protein
MKQIYRFEVLSFTLNVAKKASLSSGIQKWQEEGKPVMEGWRNFVRKMVATSAAKNPKYDIMAKNAVLSVENTRSFTLTLEPISGGLTMFYAFINGTKVIQADGSKKRTWTGKIPGSQTTIKVRAIGIADASFAIGIDLPGTANDQNISFQLTDGYYETQITI